MSRGLFKISVIMALSVIAFSSNGKKSNGSPRPYLETRLHSDKAVEGEVLIYEVVLHTSDSNIAGLQLSQNPSFGNLPVSRSAADNHLVAEGAEGERYFSAVIDRFFIYAAQPGKHKIMGGAYDVGYNRQVSMQDPFWGPYVADKVDVVSLSAPDVSVNVSALPEKGKPGDFSGAVGDFAVEVEVPSGSLHSGGEAFAVVTVSGVGDLSGAALPDVRSMFPPELQFHSMTETRSHYVKEGRMGSEIEIECAFTPQAEGKFEIGECSFSYFNPIARKYERALSVPVEVEIAPSKSAQGAPPQYMDI